MEHNLVLCGTIVISRSTFGGYFVCHLFTLPTAAEEEVTALVADNGSGTCKAGFAGDDAPHEKEVTALAADNGSGMCRAGFARDDATHAVFPSNQFPSSQNRHNASGIMVGMDQQDINSSDEAQSKRRKTSAEYPSEHGIVTKCDDIENTTDDTVEREDTSCLSGDLEIDPTIDEV